MQTPDDSLALCYTIYDPFAEALYCRETFNAAAQVANGLGCSLIIAVTADDVLGAPVCRYRKNGEDWKVEAVRRPPIQTSCFD
jgi:hypothetical protein